MTDIVRHLETIANALNIQFEYGDISYLNLAVAHAPQLDQVFLLAEPPVRNSNFSLGNVVTGKTFTGAFSLIKRSSIDEQYFNEMTPGDNSNSKYAKYIEPMIQLADTISRSLNCLDNTTILEFGCLDCINFLDANRDGVLIRYRIREDV